MQQYCTVVLLYNSQDSIAIVHCMTVARSSATCRALTVDQFMNLDGFCQDKAVELCHRYLSTLHGTSHRVQG